MISPAEPFGQQQGDCGFADGSRPGEQEQARMEDGGWRMVFGLGCHRLSSILYPRFGSGRGSSRSSTRPAARMRMLTRCAGVAQPPR